MGFSHGYGDARRLGAGSGDLLRVMGPAPSLGAGTGDLLRVMGPASGHGSCSEAWCWLRGSVGTSTGASTRDGWGTSTGASTWDGWDTSTGASTGDGWDTSTGINPGVTISAVPPELYAQCGFNAGGMTDFVTRGL